jgi:hypothetical protein
MKKSIAVMFVVVMAFFTTAIPVFAKSYSSPVANVNYKVTYNLTDSESYNMTNTVRHGNSYKTTITPKKGYVIKSIQVLMGGKDISKTAVNGNDIYIKNVTGDLVINVDSVKETQNGTTAPSSGSNSGSSGNKQVGTSNTSPETGDSLTYVVLLALLAGAAGIYSFRKVKSK